MPDTLLKPYCQHLRTKRYYISDAPPATYLAEETATTGYWCLQTMGVVGPDDNFVSPGECKAHRACCCPTGLLTIA
ncbi:MAG: hypothetical protein EXS64_16110 [Candidatus Latescibacteria bacterium]|nr:hypothetical protein [Candidatus Latescibacterota bacterium]